MDCPESVLEEKLIEREKRSGRVDDDVESIKRRYKKFHQETDPFIKYYEENIGKL